MEYNPVHTQYRPVSQVNIHQITIKENTETHNFSSDLISTLMMFYMSRCFYFLFFILFLVVSLTSSFVPRAGAFLVPYILMVFVIGVPIFFSELFVGQYSGLGPNQAYEYLAPFFHGKYIENGN